MTNPSQQLEDKKKGCRMTFIDNKSDVVHFKFKCGELYAGGERTALCPVCKAEIAILEQAIAEKNEILNKLHNIHKITLYNTDLGTNRICFASDVEEIERQIKNIQSQQNTNTTSTNSTWKLCEGELEHFKSKDNDPNNDKQRAEVETGSADTPQEEGSASPSVNSSVVSNLLQKQRQEIFRVKVCNLMGMEESEEFFGNREDAKNRFDEIIEDYRKNKDLMKDDAISGLYYPVNFYNEQPQDNILENVNIALWGKCETDCGTEYTEEWSTIYLEKIELKQQLNQPKTEQ